MSELDPRLASLLRHSPPPAVLDQAHRAAVHAAARQAWFRQQARRRRQGWAMAAAACLAAGLAGWALHAELETPQTAAAPVMALQERGELAAAQPMASGMKDKKEDAQPADRPMGEPARLRAPAAAQADTRLDGMLGNATAVAGAAAPAPAMAPPAAPAAPAAFAAPDAMVVAEAGAASPTPRRAMAKSVVETPAAERKTAPPATIAIPADAPERGRLLAAAAVLDAALNHRLATADRTAALQAALASLDRIVHPAAEDLRRRLRNALQLP